MLRNRELLHKIFKYGTLLGCFSITSTDAVAWYAGNLSLYTSSYLLVKHDTLVTGSASWTLALYGLFWILPTGLSGMLAHKIGNGWTMFLGIMFNEIGLIWVWLALMNPKLPLEIGLGAICGLGMCFIFTSTFLYVTQWTDKYTCMILAIIQNAMTVGSLFVNPLMTWYINPLNETPAKDGKPIPYFSDPGINDRVPKMIMWLFIITSAVSLAGFLMIRNKDSLNQDVYDETVPLTEEHKNSFENLETDSYNCNDLTVRQMLKTKTYYAMLYMVLNADVSFITVSAFYKEFGLTTISDDFFLSLSGMTSGLSAFLANIASGIFLEYFGARHFHMGLYGLLSIVSFFFYFSPYGGKAVYYLSVQLFLALSASSYSDISLSILKLFGKSQFPLKYFMVFIVTLGTTFFIPLMLENVTFYLGYFALFALTGAFNFVAFLIVTVVLPNQERKVM